MKVKQVAAESVCPISLGDTEAKLLCWVMLVLNAEGCEAVFFPSSGTLT